MMNSKVVPKYGLVTLALLAFVCSLAFAYDPSPLQDFCVAVNNSASAGMYICIIIVIFWSGLLL